MIGDSFQDLITVAASNGGTNVPVTLSWGSNLVISGQTATAIVVAGVGGNLLPTDPAGTLTASTSLPFDTFSLIYQNGPDDPINEGGAGVSNGHSVRIPGFDFCVEDTPPDLEIVKTASPAGAVSPGDTITYTIEVTNNGPGSATAVTVTDTLPTGVTYVPGSSSATYWVDQITVVPGSFTHNYGGATFDIAGLSQTFDTTGSIPAGATLTSYEFTVTGSTVDFLSDISLAATYPGGTAYSLAAGSFGGGGPGAFNETRGPDPLAGSAEGVYQLIWGDVFDGVGGDDNTITAASFTINHETTTVGLRLRVTNPSAAAPGLVTATVPEAGGIDLEPGETMTVTFQVTVDDPAPGGITQFLNTAAAAATGVPPVSDTATNPLGGADVAVTKTLLTPGTCSAGQQVTYLVAVTNNGPLVATNVVVSDTPSNVIIQCVSSASCAAFPCTIPSLAVGATETITVVGVIGAIGVFENAVSVAADQADSDLTNNSDQTSHLAGNAVNAACEFDNVAFVSADTNDPKPADNVDATGNGGSACAVDLAITKSASPDPVAVGETLTYTLTVTNNGPDGATSVVVTDPLPSQVTFQGAVPIQGTCSEAGGTVSCNIGDLANGATATVTVTVILDTTAVSDPPCPAGSMSNVATVGATESDTDSANDQAQICTATQAQLRVVKSLVPNTDIGTFDLQIAGVTYAAAVGNGGDTGFQGVDAGTPVTFGELAVSPAALNSYDVIFLCVDGHGDVLATSNEVVTGTGATADVTIPAGGAVTTLDQQVTCTVSNIRKANIAITKNATPADETNFDFISVKRVGPGPNQIGDFTLDGELVDGADADSVNNQLSFQVSANRTYQVTELVPAGWELTDISCTDSTSNSTVDVAGQTATLVLDPGDTLVCTFFNRQLSQLTGTVWLDVDGDGVEDNGEPGIAGVTVFLCDASTPVCDAGTEIATAVTDADGNYVFPDLMPGNYQVQVDDTDPALDGLQGSPGNGVGNSGTIALPPGGTEVVDFGYLPDAGTAAVEGTVWSDADGDGIEDPDEVGIAGVTVQLFNADGTPALDSGGQPITAITGPDGSYLLTGTPVLIGTTVTDASGNYSFNNLPDGDYVVEVQTAGTAVDGYDQTTQNATGGVELVTLAGADSTDHDFGFFDSGLVTNPVTLASFEASGTSFRWATATESGNVGFFLWAWNRETGDWQAINESLIASEAVYSTDPQHYAYDAGLLHQGPFMVEDVDIYGRSRFHGPFEADQRFGHKVAAQPIDWLAVRVAHERAARSRSAAKAASSGTASGAELLVAQTGLYRVTYEQLLAGGVDFRGTLKRRLALLGPDGPVPMRVESPQGRFGPGGWLEFLGEAMESLYTETQVYRLVVDAAQALRPAVDHKPVNPRAVAPTSYLETLAVGQDRLYSFGSPNGDPWFDARLLASSQPAEKVYRFELDGYLPDQRAPELRVELWGVTDWPAAPDHHAEVSVNATVVAEALFDGLSEQTLKATLTGLSADGSEELVVRLPHDTGVGFDLVHVEGFSIIYPRAVIARDGRLRLEASSKVLEVRGMPSPKAVVYRLEDGQLTRIDALQSTLEADGYRLRFNGTAGMPATCWVADVAALLTPQIRPGAAAVDLLDREAELLIVAHPSFLAGIEPLAAARRDDGLSVRVVDLEDVYAAYSGGVIDPEAIRSYVADAHARIATRYLLLVGSDTYDYLDHLGLGGISFVPTLYGATDDIVSFAPIDTRFGDIDGDHVPEVAVGRLPVRTPDELDTMVRKILAYPAMAAERTAVFAADGYDAANAYSFTADSESLAATLPASWQLTRAYIDQLGLAGAKELLIDTLDAGVSLASFFGHSGPTVWSFSGLLSAGDAAALDNRGRPTVITQWGCWNTYYVSPYYETMGHQLMAGGDPRSDRGAAAVLGASTLTTAEGERELAAVSCRGSSSPATVSATPSSPTSEPWPESSE